MDPAGAYAVPAPADESCADLQLDMRRATFVPGILHVVHNIMQSLSSALVGWDAFIDSLRHVSRLLARKWSRQRFIATCVLNTAFESMADQLKTFSVVVYEGRWGAVLQCLDALAPIKKLLCATWNTSRYRFGVPGAEHDRSDQADFAVSIDTVGQAIADNAFWGFAAMVRKVAAVLARLSSWAESCPCHSGTQQLQHLTEYRRSAMFERILGVSRCPLNGCRAPELAAGQVFVTSGGGCRSERTHQAPQLLGATFVLQKGVGRQMRRH